MATKAATTVFENGIYKTTDEYGRVTYSDTNTPPPSAPQAAGADAEVVSNKAKGVVRTMEVMTDRNTGKSVVIERDGDGNITPESQKKLKKDFDAAFKKQWMENAEAEAKIRQKIAEEEAAKAANENKLIGVSGEIKLTLPNGYEVINIEGKAGHVATDTSVSVGTDISGQAKKVAGQEGTPTPGLSIGVKVVIPEGTLIKSLGSKTAKKVQWTDKEVEKFKAEYERLKQQSVQDGIDGKPPSQINADRMKELKENIEAVGNRVGKAVSE
jgi:hypothetical protein